LEPRMFCEIYSCHMSVKACIARQKNARQYLGSHTWGQGRIKPGALDINCQNCEQGRKIMEEYSTISLPGPKSKEEIATQVCSQKDCEHGGKPQPIKNFKLHPKSRTPFKMCNSCLAKRTNAGQQRRRKKNERQNDLATAKPSQNSSLEILLNDLPEVLNKIVEVAEKEERTPEAQVRYLLKTDNRLFHKPRYSSDFQGGIMP
jgi:hypothetical protein